MKTSIPVSLYMAISANGLIARSDDSTPWSEVEWEHFSSFINTRKNIIIGRKTYDIMSKAKSFDAFQDVQIIVLSQQALPDKVPEYVRFVQSPEEAIALVASSGLLHAVVAGGSTINGLFLEQGLVSEIRLDIEPILFTKGISLCTTILPFEQNLKLTEVEKIGADTVHIAYSVQ